MNSAHPNPDYARSPQASSSISPPGYACGPHSHHVHLTGSASDSSAAAVTMKNAMSPAISIFVSRSGGHSCMGIYLPKRSVQFFPRQTNAANYQSRQHPAGSQKTIGISRRWPRSCGRRKPLLTSSSSSAQPSEPAEHGHLARLSPAPKCLRRFFAHPKARASFLTSCTDHVSLGGSTTKPGKSVSRRNTARTQTSSNLNWASNAGA